MLSNPHRRAAHDSWIQVEREKGAKCTTKDIEHFKAPSLQGGSSLVPNSARLILYGTATLIVLLIGLIWYTGTISPAVVEQPSADKSDEPTQEVQVMTEAKPDPAQADPWFIRVGVYRDVEELNSIKRKLESVGIAYLTAAKQTTEGEQIALGAGPFSSVEAANSARAALQKVGLDGPLIQNADRDVSIDQEPTVRNSTVQPETPTQEAVTRYSNAPASDDNSLVHSTDNNSIDATYAKLAKQQCDGGFFCKESIRWKLCEGRWAENPKPGETICKGSSNNTN